MATALNGDQLDALAFDRFNKDLTRSRNTMPAYDEAIFRENVQQKIKNFLNIINQALKTYDYDSVTKAKQMILKIVNTFDVIDYPEFWEQTIEELIALGEPEISIAYTRFKMIFPDYKDKKEILKPALIYMLSDNNNILYELSGQKSQLEH